MENLINLIFRYNLEYVAVIGMIILMIAYIRGSFTVALEFEDDGFDVFDI
jgi:hypothetical protein